MKKLKLQPLANAKKLSRKELKNIFGGENYGSGFSCGNVCKPNDGYCEQFGLKCGLWVQTYPNGDIAYHCLKCI